MTAIYGITGMPLSGKTTVANMMKEQGYSVLDMGDVVRKEMKKEDVEAGNEASFVGEKREKLGMDAIAQLSVPYLKKLTEKTDKIIITGMRGWSEKKRFEKEMDRNVEIVAVWASRKTRKSRKEARQREEDVKGQEFHERDLREIRNGMGKLIALSDHIIVNNGISKKELEKRVKKLHKGDN